MSNLNALILDIAMDRALHVALDAHAGQLRRGSDAPYVVHPLQVALALSRLGASSEVIQAGVLHDLVEDCDEWSPDRLAAEFGSRVADLVAEVTENKDHPWQERKEHGIASVATLSAEAVLIKGCDKLHNLVSLATSLEGAEDVQLVWAQFRGKREGTLETSARLVAALCMRVPAELQTQLRVALGRISRY